MQDSNTCGYYGASHQKSLTGHESSVKICFVAVHNMRCRQVEETICITGPGNISLTKRPILENHMFAIPEQFSNATKTNLESHFALLSALTSKTFEGMEKLVDLNINAAKATLEESSANARQLLTAKDPQEFFALAGSQVQPNAEKALSYGRQLASIAAGTGAEFSKAAESQIVEANRKVISLVDEVSKNAPAGSESFVAALKTAISNANAGYEQVTKTTKQAVEAMESNLNSAVSQFAQAARKVTPSAAAA
jgi:phasin family protein